MYKKIKQQFLPDINSLATLYIHKKSGARVITFKNDDPNKTFCVSFKTPPKDSSGLTHILEHCVLSGSKKFRAKDPFSELIKSSLNTFLNAMTFPDKTMYPVASINDKDFKNLMDVYLDAVFFPKIHEQDEIFLQEGWHHEIFNKEDDIVYNGVVYNEMLGATSGDEAVLINEIKASLFPDTEYRFVSGGDPKYIPTLTYEAFKNFHKQYYHPANSYIVLYGDMDFEERLNWLDEAYLKEFDKIDVDTKINFQKPFEKPIFVEAKYPITEEEDEENKTSLSYNVVLPKITDVKMSMAFELLSNVIITNNNAIIKERLIKSGICTDIDAAYYDIYQPFISIIGKGTNKEDEEEFIKIIDETFVEIINNGINKEELLAEITFAEFKARENKHGNTPKGVIYAIRMLTTYLFEEDKPFDSLDFVKYYNELKDLINSDYYENLVRDYFLNNNHKSYVKVIPSKDIAKIEADELKEKLRVYKESLSDDELEALIAQNERLRSFQETPSSKEDLDTMPKLSLEDISPNPREYNTTKVVHDGIDIYHSNYWTNDIVYGKLFFNLEHLSKEELQYAKLISQLIGTINTKKRTFGELEALKKLKSGGVYNNIDFFEDKKNNFNMITFSYTFSAMAENLEFIFNLMLEEMFSTNYEKDILLERINEYKLSLEQTFMYSGHAIAINEAKATIDLYAYLQKEMNLRGYYKFLTKLQKEINKNFDKVLNDIEKVSRKIFNKHKLFVQVTLKDNLKPLTQSLDNITCELSSENYPKYEHKFEISQHKIGLKCASNVNFNALVADVGYENYDYSYQVVANVLRNDYLYKNIRVKGGAYGAMFSIAENGTVFFASYRDPNLVQTFDVYKEAYKYLKEFEIDLKDYENYIIGSFQGVDDDPHVSTLGYRGFETLFLNNDYEFRKQNRMRILNSKPSDVKKLGELLENKIKFNSSCTVGNSLNINKEKDFFDVLEKLY